MAERQRAPEPSPADLRARLRERLAALRAELEKLRFETDRRWDELLAKLAERPEEILPEELLVGPLPSPAMSPPRGRVSVESARRLDEAGDQVEALTRFLEECLQHASRAILVVDRSGRLEAWKAAGFGGSRPSGALPAEALARLREGSPQLLGEGDEVSLALGAGDAVAAVLVPFVVREKVSGAAYADAVAGEIERFDPEAIALLTYVAGLVVDRLAKRKLVPSPALRPLAAETEGAARPGDERPLGGPLAPPIGDERREEARRFARLLASEIKLYNEHAVEEGRERGNLYARLRDDIERGRRLYEQRVPPDVRSGTDYYQEELVQVLADGRPEVLGK